MPRTNIVIIILLCLLSAGAKAEEQHYSHITRLPYLTSGPTYHDIDWKGRLLQIDYSTENAKVITQIPLDAFFEYTRLDAWYVESEQLLYVVAFPDFKRQTYTADIFYIDMQTDTVINTGKKIEYGENYLFIPMKDGSFYFRGRDGRQIYNVYTDEFHTTQAFIQEMMPHGVFGDSDYFFVNGSWLYRRGNSLSIVSLESGDITDQYRPAQLVGVSADDVDVGILDANDRTALLTYRNKKGDLKSRFCIVDLHTKEAVVLPEPITLLGGHGYLKKNSDGNFLITYIGMTWDSAMDSTGDLTHYFVDMKERKLRPPKKGKYDPDTEIVIINEQGAGQVFERKRFDYLNINDYLEIARKTTGNISEETKVKEKELKELLGQYWTHPDDRNIKYLVKHLEIFERTEVIQEN